MPTSKPQYIEDVPNTPCGCPENVGLQHGDELLVWCICGAIYHAEGEGENRTVKTLLSR